jgi:hypothetical protein
MIYVIKVIFMIGFAVIPASAAMTIARIIVWLKCFDCR